MQFRNFFLLLLVGLFIFKGGQLAAQEVKTNERGEKIVVYPDGSWRYFDESETESKPIAKKDGNIEASPNLSDGTDEKPAIASKDEAAILAAELALAEESLAIEMEDDAREERKLLEAQLETRLENKSLSKKQIKDLETRIKIAKRREKEATNKRKKASKAARKAEMEVDGQLADQKDLTEETSGENGKTQRQVQDGSREKTINEERGNGQSIEGETERKAEEKVAYNISKKSSQKKLASFDSKDDVMLYPPKPACSLVFDGKDEFSGKNRKVVAKQPFFNYTPEKLRSFIKDKEYIDCQAYLSSLSGGYKFLTLEITIASERAQREYGIIEKGSVLTIKLLNGDNVKLFNNKTDTGTLNSLEKSVSYTAQYIINSGNEKLLRKKEVDKVRVIWSTGYEDYEVYELDFFIDQFNCLNRK